MSTPTKCAQFEADSGVILPDDYKAFVTDYGAGEFCGCYQFYSPIQREVNCDLATWNSIMRECPEMIDPFVVHIGKTEDFLFFAANTYGDSCGWNTAEVTDKKHHEYAIYFFHEDAPPARQAAKSFREFFDKCLNDQLTEFFKPGMKFPKEFRRFTIK